MEVSSKNFLAILPEILEKLETAAFVSFDAEYTGLKGHDGETTSLFDTTSQRYEILRRVVLNNSAPQFGLAIFQRKCGPEYSAQQIYAVDAYCFYLAEPCFAGFNMQSIQAAVDIDCCQFLNGIQFNFDKWFNNSVPYLNQNKIAELEKYLDDNPDLLEDCNRDCLIGCEYLYEKETHGALTEEDKKNILRKCRGFSAIVDVIAKRKMPVVGHNMALDLMYFFHQFCKDLPEKYEDFKSEVEHFLPVVFDTKYMTVRLRKNLDHPALNHAKKNIDQLQCSGLYVIYKTSSAVKDKFSPIYSLSDACDKFKEALEIGKTKELEDEENSPMCHEPSFDALVTGIVFLNLAHIACRISKDLLTKEEAPDFKEVMQFVRHWQDQIFVARATVMTMCLKGDDPRPNRSWVRIVSPEEGVINVSQIMDGLKSDEEIKKQLSGVDHRQISPKEVVLAVSRVQWKYPNNNISSESSAYDLCEKLQSMGYEATKVWIPWDKKRYDTADSYKTDHIYDTGRNKFFS